MLYDLTTCPHRVTMDLFADSRDRDAANPFVQMLWEKGSLFEAETIGKLGIPFLDLSKYEISEKEQLTNEAMRRGENLIYGGRIQHDDLVGLPDLLRGGPGGYMAGDIKSGSGEEGPEDQSKPKPHYAVQLALYTDILERKGLSPGRRAFVWDVHGREVTYNYAETYGTRDPRTLWQDYEDCLQEARAIVERRAQTLPAYSSACKLCHWYSACLKRLTEDNDLTLIPELGRSKRDGMSAHVRTVRELAAANLDDFMAGKKTVFPGIGPEVLQKFHLRATLQTMQDAKPVLYGPIRLPEHSLELFFDIEVDPMRDICYLHGFVERRGRDNSTEKFVSFFADAPTPEAEGRAFADAWRYLRDNRPCSIYYYSKYERTIYRKLREKFPAVCSADDIEELFDVAHAIDLYYDIVKKATEWPTKDLSIKTLAKYLGFAWRDTHPSGAASIEWYDRWVKTGDERVRQRIMDYNEDDCTATRVVLDGIRNLTPSYGKN